MCVCVCLSSVWFGLVVLNPYVPFNIHYMMERISYTALPCRFLLILQFFMSMWSWLIFRCEYISSFFLSAASDATIDEAIMNWANKKVCSYLHFINFQIFHAEEERHWIPHWIHRTILLWQLKNTNSSNPFYIIPPMESYEMELLLMSLYLTAKTSSVCHFPANSVLCAVCAYMYIVAFNHALIPKWKYSVEIHALAYTLTTWWFQVNQSIQYFEFQESYSHLLSRFLLTFSALL